MFNKHFCVINLARKCLVSRYNKTVPKITNKIISSHEYFTNDILKRNYATNDNYNRDSYDKEIEKLLNDQINTEFNAGYSYLAMANYYGRSNVALPGCYGFFMKMYYEEQEHALGMIKYQNLRGGVVKLMPICQVEEENYSDLVKSFELALQMEKDVKKKLLSLHKAANKVDDTNIADFLDVYIDQQEKSICEIARLFTRAMMLMKTEVGKYLFDRELHDTHVKENPGKVATDLGPKYYS